LPLFTLSLRVWASFGFAYQIMHALATQCDSQFAGAIIGNPAQTLSEAQGARLPPSAR
jgi:hypothetical protein